MTDHFEVDTQTGLLRGVDYIPSPHCDDRPAACQADLIVIHCISLPPGNFGGDAVSRLFTGTLSGTEPGIDAELAGLRVSAHLLIKRDGSITQYVPFDRRAWHAGESVYRGRSRCNDYSVGIELEGTDNGNYEPAQYDALAGAISALLRAYPTLSAQRIAGHSDIAPMRKHDPGPGFSWQRLHRELARHTAPT